MRTMLLSTDDWDLMVDAEGNIAVADDPYARAQDAASEIKLFQTDAYYDQARGVPYWLLILGQQVNIPLMKAYFVAAAKLTPGVVSAQCFITRVQGREVQGQVQVRDANGVVAAAGF